MAWVKFTQAGKGFSPKAKLWRGGQIGFTQGAVKRYRLDKKKYVVLYFDSDEQKIGVQLTNDSEAEGAISIVNRGKSCFISAKSFLEFYGIRYPSSAKLDIFEESENFLVIPV